MFKLSLVYILRNKTQHGLIFISVFLGTIGFIVFGAIMVGFWQPPSSASAKALSMQNAQKAFCPIIF